MTRNMKAFAMFSMVLGFVPLFAASAGCDKAQEPTQAPKPQTTAPLTTASATSASASATTVAEPAQAPGPNVKARPTASVAPAPDDPIKGQFPLADATKGLAGKGKLSAVIDTDQGSLTCELFDDKAPITVANFVGLARGLRPWKDPNGKWVKKPAYDNTTFLRIIKGFMIQGGDPKGTGTGEPGYVIPDEIWEGAVHDRPGLLCMANRGPNTNGQQFFITDASAPHLDNNYTIFGECSPVDVVHKIAAIQTRGDRPDNAPKIKKVTIKR